LSEWTISDVFEMELSSPAPWAARLPWTHLRWVAVAPAVVVSIMVVATSALVATQKIYIGGLDYPYLSFTG
jgi:hypothetical protein